MCASLGRRGRRSKREGGLVRGGWRSGGWGVEWGERVRGDSRRGLEGLVSGVFEGEGEERTVYYDSAFRVGF